MAGRLSPDLDRAIGDLRRLGVSKSEIARRLRVSRLTVQRYCDPALRQRHRAALGVKATSDVEGSLAAQMTLADYPGAARDR